MKYLKLKLARRNPRLSMVQRTIWGVVKSVTVVILAPVARVQSKQSEVGWLL